MESASLEAFGELAVRHRSEVVRLCRSILRDEHLAEDAAQVTFARLWRRIEQGRGPARSGSWLRRVAVSTSVDLARARAGRPRETEIDEAFPDRAADRGIEAELFARFEEALAGLPEGQRTVFVLRHDGGLALAAVAEMLGVAVPTVKTQFARACIRLQEKLGPFRPGKEDGP